MDEWNPFWAQTVTPASATVLAVLCLLLFSFIAIPLYDAYAKDVSVGIQFTLIAILFASALLKENETHPFSITMSFFFFCYLFFYCAGVYRFVNERYIW